jgi:hypothetical protein
MGEAVILELFQNIAPRASGCSFCSQLIQINHVTTLQYPLIFALLPLSLRSRTHVGNKVSSGQIESAGWRYRFTRWGMG